MGLTSGGLIVYHMISNLQDVDTSFHRAYAAYIAGILINVVGFAGASAFTLQFFVYPCRLSNFHRSTRTAGRTVPIAATHIYQMSFFTGFGVSALIYCGLNYFFPPRGSHFVGSKFEEVDVSEADDVEDDRQSDTEKADGKEGRADVLVYEA